MNMAYTVCVQTGSNGSREERLGRYDTEEEAVRACADHDDGPPPEGPAHEENGMDEAGYYVRKGHTTVHHFRDQSYADQWLEDHEDEDDVKVKAVGDLNMAELDAEFRRIEDLGRKGKATEADWQRQEATGERMHDLLEDTLGRVKARRQQAKV